MRKSVIVAGFDAGVERVWNLVTDNSNYSWRSDLLKIEQFDEGQRFIEYTRESYQTEFTVTRKEVFKQYEFDMKNKNFSGHWTGKFSTTSGGGTKIEFTEEISIPNPVFRLLSYWFMDLKKMQETYVADLRNALEE